MASIERVSGIFTGVDWMSYFNRCSLCRGCPWKVEKDEHNLCTVNKRHGELCYYRCWHRKSSQVVSAEKCEHSRRLICFD